MLGRNLRLPAKNPVKAAECPECGSLNTPVKNTGHDEDGRTIRARRCKQCNHLFGTVEVILPPEFAFSKTDTYRETIRRSRIAQRSRDRIFVGAIKIVPGKQTNWCAKSLHKLTGNNLSIDKAGNRHCRACNRAATRLRYELNKINLNYKERQRYHRKRRRLGTINRENNAFLSNNSPVPIEEVS